MLAPPLPTIDDDKKLEPLNLSPDGGSFTRAAPPLGSRWLRFDSKRFAFPGRSHLSPDGGGVTRAAVHRLAADGYGKRAKGKRVTSSSAS